MKCDTSDTSELIDNFTSLYHTLPPVKRFPWLRYSKKRHKISLENFIRSSCSKKKNEIHYLRYISISPRCRGIRAGDFFNFLQYFFSWTFFQNMNLLLWKCLLVATGFVAPGFQESDFHLICNKKRDFFSDVLRIFWVRKRQNLAPSSREK